MELFRAHELMALVIGNENYDWDAFEQSAKYKGGYTSGDPTVCVMHSTTSNFCPLVDTHCFILLKKLIFLVQIRLFWEVFHELALEDKKKFLLFLTGSDRIAIGAKALQVRVLFSRTLFTERSNQMHHFSFHQF